MQTTTLFAVLMVWLSKYQAGWPSGYFQGNETCVAVAGSLFLFAVLAWDNSHIDLFRLDNEQSHPIARQFVRKSEKRMRMAMLGIFGLQLTVLGWADQVRGVFADVIFMMTPFVAMSAIGAFFIYPVYRGVYIGSCASEFLEEFPGRKQFMVRRLRRGVASVLIPALLILICADIIREPFLTTCSMWFQTGGVSSTGAYWVPFFLSAIAMLGVLFLAPFLMLRIWGACALVPCPLRDRLEILLRRTRIRYLDILVMHDSGIAPNASVVGLIRPWQYIVVTDTLIYDLPDDHIEAIVAHEAGHIAHGHAVYQFLLIFCGAMISMFFLERVEDFAQGVPSSLAEWMVWAEGLMTAAICVMIWRHVLQFFEYQADVSAALTLGSKTNKRSKEYALNVCGIEAVRAAILFASRFKVTTQAKWFCRHPHFAGRVDVLEHLLHTKGALERFVFISRAIKMAICIGSILAGWRLFLLWP